MPSLTARLLMSLVIAAALAPAAQADGPRRLADQPYGDHPRQRFDVYLPAEPKGAPILLMVHGGAWMAGSRTGPGVVANKMAHWVDRGWIFVSAGYRLHPQVTPKTQAEDVARALAAVQAAAPGWGGDPARVVLMGHSAGAHLVALLGASPPLAQRLKAQRWLATVVIDSAALDVPLLMGGRHPGFYDAVFGNDRLEWEAVSPAQRLDAEATPMLVVCSTRRPDDPCDQARRFATRAAAQGVVVRVLEQDLDHAQINDRLGLAGPYTDAVDAFLATLPTLAR